MDWTQIELRHLRIAMGECKRMGPQQFREKYGFHSAKNVEMHLGNDGPFEARPLIAAAYASKYPGRTKLVPRDFKNNNAHDFLSAKFSFSQRRLS